MPTFVEKPEYREPFRRRIEEKQVARYPVKEELGIEVRPPVSDDPTRS